MILDNQQFQLVASFFDEPKTTNTFNANYIKNKFKHNNRVWIAVMPCFIVMIAFGGKLYPYYKNMLLFLTLRRTLGTLLFGVLISWIFDALGVKEAYASFIVYFFKTLDPLFQYG